MLSLFCGAGGLDLGFEKAGFDVDAAFDLRPDAILSYNYNRSLKSRVARVGNVRDITCETLDFLAGRKFEPRGIIGGPPCQSFSRATHSGEDDPRHDLPLKYAKLLKDLNARKPVEFFVLENVPGLLKHKHADRLKNFLQAFEDAGFSVTQSLLNARSFGVAQNRPRLIFIGINRNIFGNLEWEPPASKKGSEKTVRDKIGHLPEATFWTRDLVRMEIEHHPNHWCMMPKSISFSTPGRLSPGTARGRSFRTLEWDSVSPTVAYGNREVHVHPSCHRRLSVHEALLLQGFPKNFTLMGSLSSQITQVSEAVPPPLAKAVAVSLIRFLKQAARDLDIGKAA
ncbi:hypothetical protein ASF28_16595 [Methylobacterium sp. Leaf99]|nr:hypothetical protein ASF28_16595 [Methylobacterium sp. Leaf99]